MQKIAILPNEKINEFRFYYERRQSIDDLCRTLAYNNQTFQKKESIFYERLIQDNLECLKFLEQFWNDCQKEYGIELKPGEEMYIDFSTNQLGVREIVQ